MLVQTTTAGGAPVVAAHKLGKGDSCWRGPTDDITQAGRDLVSARARLARAQHPYLGCGAEHDCHCHHKIKVVFWKDKPTLSRALKHFYGHLFSRSKKLLHESPIVTAAHGMRSLCRKAVPHPQLSHGHLRPPRQCGHRVEQGVHALQHRHLLGLKTQRPVSAELLSLLPCFA